MHVPELVQQLRVGHLRRVVRDLNRLRVTRASRAHLLVGRVVQGSTFVTRDGLDHPRHLVEKMLDTPEAAARESRFLHISPPDPRPNPWANFRHMMIPEDRNSLTGSPRPPRPWPPSRSTAHACTISRQIHNPATSSERSNELSPNRCSVIDCDGGVRPVR